MAGVFREACQFKNPLILRERFINLGETDFRPFTCPVDSSICLNYPFLLLFLSVLASICTVINCNTHNIK